MSTNVDVSNLSRATLEKLAIHLNTLVDLVVSGNNELSVRIAATDADSHAELVGKWQAAMAELLTQSDSELERLLTVRDGNIH